MLLVENIPLCVIKKKCPTEVFQISDTFYTFTINKCHTLSFLQTEIICKADPQMGLFNSMELSIKNIKGHVKHGYTGNT